MKRIALIIQVLAITYVAEAQSTAPIYARNAYLSPQSLSVSYQKTTNLIFPSAIKTVDRGTADIIVQKAGGVENVLKIKAGKHRFEETNLSVITADGQFYSFNVNYNPSPGIYTVMVKPGTFQSSGEAKSTVASKAIFSEHMTNETKLKKLAAQASISRKNINRISDKAYDMEATVSGLYIAEDKFFYKIMVSNSSNINYDIGAINFYVRDRKKVKRMATQEIGLEPLLVVGNSEPIAGKTNRMLIVVLPKHTISSDKRLVIEMEEANGGRNLTCLLKNSTLLKARPIIITDAVDNIPNVLSAGK